MLPSDLSSATSLDELWRVYADNCEPFYSVAQCDLFLKAANILRARLPAETEGNGERVSLRDLIAAIEFARKVRYGLCFASRPATVVVPPDRLR